MTTRTIGVAIAIPEPHGGDLQRVRISLGDPHATSIPTHVTLLPPTTVHTDELGTIEKHLRAVAESEDPFELHLRGTGSFAPMSPVVFVRVAAGADGCERVESRVRSGPLDRDLTFPYHPHVTIAHDLPDDRLRRALDEMAHYEVRFPVWGFSLYEHGSDGVWRPQRDFALGRELPGPHRSSTAPSGG